MFDNRRDEAARLEPLYSVTSLCDESVYSMLMTSEQDSRRIDVRFHFLNRHALEMSAPESYRDIEVEFVLEKCGEDEEAVTRFVLTKNDLLTLQKLLTNAVEHSTVRRHQWFAELVSNPEQACVDNDRKVARHPWTPQEALDGNHQCA